jgi:hypothetical protein
MKLYALLAVAVALPAPSISMADCDHVWVTCKSFAMTKCGKSMDDVQLESCEDYQSCIKKHNACYDEALA